jgi:electron transfer flavoprotein alpha subunit
MKTLLIAEHDQHGLKNVTAHAAFAAGQLSDEIDILVVGKNCRKAAEEAATLPKVKQVLLADDEVYAHQFAENVAPLIAQIAPDYAYVLAAATTFGKNILPRAAALLDCNMMSDVMKVVSPDTFLRPIYAGNVIATVQSSDKIKFLTIRTTLFPAAKKTESQAAIQTVTHKIEAPMVQFVDQQLTQSSRPELTDARIVVSGGRGLKSAENFKLLETIADELGAAIGASRAAVDAGFAPNDYQVGQTGKVVAPDLYIAIGISGAIQHLAGMKDSKVVVAINNDPDAPILQAADYAIIGDLFKILPELQEALAKVGCHS